MARIYKNWKIGPGTDIQEMVVNIDLAPTILDYAGVKIPDDMQGKSWREVAAGKRVRWRDAVYYKHAGRFSLVGIRR